MNSENENKNNEDVYKAMTELSLPQLEERARHAGCKLEIEFDITQGQSGDNDTFQEGGTFVATFVPFLEEEIEEFEKFAGELLASLVKEEIENDGVNWPSENSINAHLNGVSEEDFQEYDKIAGDIDLTGTVDTGLKGGSSLMSVDIELKEEIVSMLKEKNDMDALICKQDMDALEAIMEEFADNADKTRAIDAFDKAKIDPEAF
ncbi:hypothetical protein LCGC14_1816380 [marine sediment metagenome]|uniref:Uncharacterized protein n=1 Tax=marine sediment metagenome TaxID=412755 RepID=A0A0F9GK71_9ZZZZ